MATVIDDFERSSLNWDIVDTYSGISSDYSYNGSRSVECTHDADVSATSQFDIGPGSTFGVYMFIADGSQTSYDLFHGVLFGFQDEDNTYAVGWHDADDTMELHKRVGGGWTTLDSAPVSDNRHNWTNIEISWGENGSITADVNGATLSATDTTYTDGMVGISREEVPFGDSYAINATYWDDFYIATSAPDPVSNAEASVNDNDEVSLSFGEPSSWGGEEGDYQIEIERNSTGFVQPSGGPSTLSAGTTQATYNPSSDNSYKSQVGIDSSIRFRINAENSAGASGWVVTDDVYTEPVPPHNPRIVRPGPETVEIHWDNISNIATNVQVYYREDTGDGYDDWEWVDGGGPDRSPAVLTVGNQLQNDAKYQFRLRSRNNNVSDWREFSEWVYADYGNIDSAFFEDGFESGNLDKWDVTSLSDGNSGVTTSGHLDGPNGPDKGSYSLRLDAQDYVQKNLGDLTGESNVHVRAAISIGSMDYEGEGFAIKWYDGSTWHNLRELEWEYNKAGWVTVHAMVPDSYISTDNRVRFQGYDSLGGADHVGVDDVAVGDIVDEYTRPTPVDNVEVDTDTRGEMTASWDLTNTFTKPSDDVETYIRETGGSWSGANREPTLTSYTFTDVEPNVEYEIGVQYSTAQHRHGTKSTEWDSTSNDKGVVVGPYSTLGLYEMGGVSTEINTDRHINVMDASYADAGIEMGNTIDKFRHADFVGVITGYNHDIGKAFISTTPEHLVYSEDLIRRWGYSSQEAEVYNGSEVSTTDYIIRGLLAEANRGRFKPITLSVSGYSEASSSGGYPIRGNQISSGIILSDTSGSPISRETTSEMSIELGEPTKFSDRLPKSITGSYHLPSVGGMGLYRGTSRDIANILDVIYGGTTDYVVRMTMAKLTAEFESDDYIHVMGDTNLTGSMDTKSGVSQGESHTMATRQAKFEDRESERVNHGIEGRVAGTTEANTDEEENITDETHEVGKSTASGTSGDYNVGQYDRGFAQATTTGGAGIYQTIRSIGEAIASVIAYSVTDDLNIGSMSEYKVEEHTYTDSEYEGSERVFQTNAHGTDRDGEREGEEYEHKAEEYWYDRVTPYEMAYLYAHVYILQAPIDVGAGTALYLGGDATVDTNDEGSRRTT